MSTKRRATTGEKMSTADTEPLPADLLRPAATESLADTQPIPRNLVQARMRRLAAGTTAPRSAQAAKARADTVEDDAVEEG